MAADQLPISVREFVNYLDGLLARLDPSGGWCAVFWQRDPEGMRACLDGREMPPWDVVEALLQDLAGQYGPGGAGPETERARSLHAAALAAYDARPGGRDALGDQLDVMLRERKYAAERQADLTRLLASAPTREQADTLRLDLAWAHDDHERATARCAELRGRMARLDRRDLDAATVFRDRGGAYAAGRSAGVGTADVPGTRGGVSADAAGVFGGGGEAGAGAGVRGGAGSWAAAGGSGGGVAGDAAGVFGGGGEAGAASGGSGGGVSGEFGGGGEVGEFDGGAGARASAGGHGGGASADAGGASGDGRAAEDAAAFGGGAVAGRARAGGGEAAEGAGRAYGDGTAAAGGAARRTPGGPYGPGAPAAPWHRTESASAVTGGAGRDDPRHAAAVPEPERRTLERPAGRAVPREAVSGGTPDAFPAVAAPEPPASRAPVPKQRKRRRGSARFAGMAEEEAVPVVVPPAGVPTLPEPAPATGRTRRGARFAGAAEEVETKDAGAQSHAVGAADRTEVARTVEALARLRAEGRSGEAHALLVELASWAPARFPLLAGELERAGLGADWQTLLWEAASLPAGRLVAAADALGAAGRAGDGQQILRQGVARPPTEIGEAVLSLVAEGRHREVRALLDAYVRARTPEEAARSAEPDPQRLVPLLLEAAEGVSDERRWDLVHALRVAGLAA